MTTSEIVKKITGIIELRGLRNFSGDSIEDFWPVNLFQKTQQILIDIRENIVDGKVTNPQAAVDKIERLPSYIHQLENGRDRDHLSYVAGGLAPVPFSFLAGVLLDDEHNTQLIDWNRQSSTWSKLDADDDLENLSVRGTENLDQEPEEIALLSSMSYRIDKQAVSKLFPDLPQVEIGLPSLDVNNHWSDEKQRRVAKEFFWVLQRASNAGVKRIHLFLAAQNSLVIRLGAVYDKRNLPEVIVYQYERNPQGAYPWGVKMPVAGNSKASIVTR